MIGRGACDDKGGCAVMVASLQLLRELEQRFGICPASDLTFMFVIEEEMGGNGSLDLAMDERLSARYGTVVVLECCDGQVHPGGRGALWYRVEIPVFAKNPPESLSGYNPLLLALEIIRGMDREGAAIRAESDPHSPAVAQALLAAADAGIELRRPVLGWEVSSDARIFAHLRPGLPVFTTGPGRLALAHSDQEQITIDELCAATLMLTLFVLRHGGFLVPDG